MLVVSTSLFRPVPLQKSDREGGRASNPHFPSAASPLQSENIRLCGVFPSYMPLLLCSYVYCAFPLFLSFKKYVYPLDFFFLTAEYLKNEQGYLFLIGYLFGKSSSLPCVCQSFFFFPFSAPPFAFFLSFLISFFLHKQLR